MTESPNPVHMASGPETRWTTVNFGEAIQGVQTPLSWSVWNQGMETATRRAFGELGLYKRSEVPVPESADLRMSGIFFGRAAGNIGTFRRIGDRMPGSSGDILEDKVFGNPVGNPAAGRQRKPPGIYARYPLILAEVHPRAGVALARALPPMLEEYRAWWRGATLDARPATWSPGSGCSPRAPGASRRSTSTHAVVSMLSPGMLEGLTKIAEEATGDASLGHDAGHRLRRHGGDRRSSPTSGPPRRGSSTSPRSSAATASTAPTRAGSTRPAGARTRLRSNR